MGDEETSVADEAAMDRIVSPVAGRKAEGEDRGLAESLCTKTIGEIADSIRDMDQPTKNRVVNGIVEIAYARAEMNK